MSSGTGISPPSAKGLPRQNKNHSTFFVGWFLYREAQDRQGSLPGREGVLHKKTAPKGTEKWIDKKKKILYNEVPYCGSMP